MRALFLALFLSSCAGNTPIPDFRAYITLPASEDGYWVKTVSKEEGRIPKAEWEKKRKSGIIILSEDWAILRNTLLQNCLTSPSCKNAVGTFDSLFYAIDNALRMLPKLPIGK